MSSLCSVRILVQKQAVPEISVAENNRDMFLCQLGWADYPAENKPKSLRCGFKKQRFLSL